METISACAHMSAKPRSKVMDTLSSWIVTSTDDPAFRVTIWAASGAVRAASRTSGRIARMARIIRVGPGQENRDSPQITKLQPKSAQSQPLDLGEAQDELLFAGGVESYGQPPPGSHPRGPHHRSLAV